MTCRVCGMPGAGFRFASPGRVRWFHARCWRRYRLRFIAESDLRDKGEGLIIESQRAGQAEYRSTDPSQFALIAPAEHNRIDSTTVCILSDNPAPTRHASGDVYGGQRVG